MGNLSRGRSGEVALYLALRHFFPCDISRPATSLAPQLFAVLTLQHRRCCISVRQSVGAQVEALQARLSAVTSSTTLASQLQDTQVPQLDGMQPMWV